jgi:hypothetical protein
MVRKAKAVWYGTGRDGSGGLSTRTWTVWATQRRCCRALR